MKEYKDLLEQIYDAESVWIMDIGSLLYLYKDENGVEKYIYCSEDGYFKQLISKKTYDSFRKKLCIKQLGSTKVNTYLVTLCYERAHKTYGVILPIEVKNRIEYELEGIIENDYASLYLTCYEIIKKCNKLGYYISGGRFNGTSLVLYLLGITEINPLPAHYICKKCKYSIFDLTNISEYRLGDLGYNLPDNRCPICGENLSKEGYDIPIEMFLGINRNKEPNFDLILAEKYQDKVRYSAFDILRENTGDFDYRADTLLKVNVFEDVTQSFLQYLFEKTGLNPKDIPSDEKNVMELFSDTKSLELDEKMIADVKVGTLGIPEYGCNEAREILEVIRPTNLFDIVKVASMLNGTGAWQGNAENLVMKRMTAFSECIASRDDIMTYLISKGINREEAYKIMSAVRKGMCCNEIKDEWVELMVNSGIPDWYIQSFRKIRYLRTKAQSAYDALLAYRLLYYKLYYPKEFYNGWIKYMARGLDRELLINGYEFVKEKYDSLSQNGSIKIGDGQKQVLDNILVVMEMYARGINFEKDIKVNEI